jgi:hypothetical protein
MVFRTMTFEIVRAMRVCSKYLVVLQLPDAEAQKPLGLFAFGWFGPGYSHIITTSHPELLTDHQYYAPVIV